MGTPKRCADPSTMSAPNSPGGFNNVSANRSEATATAAPAFLNRAMATLFPDEELQHAENVADLLTPEHAAEMRYLMKRARRTGIASTQLDLARPGRVRVAFGAPLRLEGEDYDALARRVEDAVRAL